MKILIIHQYFLEDDDPGGSRWNEFSKMWTSQGHRVTILAGMMHANGEEKRTEYKGLLFKRKMQGDVNVIRCHVSEAYNKNFIGRLWGYFSFMISSLWGGLFYAKGKFDLVLVTSPPLFVGVSGYFISRIKRIPLIFEVRDLWPESAIDTGILTNGLIIKVAFWFERFIYRKAILINVLTPAFYNKLSLEKGIPTKKLLMVPNAADFNLSEGLLNEFDTRAFREDKGIEDKFVIVYVGAHGIANHLDQVLDAAVRLKDTNVLFMLIGQGMERNRLIESARQRSITNVVFIESVSKQDIFKYILAADMGLSVLKRVDTFKTVYSNKTFDYMSCKKPILMAIDGVSRELVEASRSGTYIEPENIEEYNRVIRQYIRDPQRLITEGENGYNYAKVNFSRDTLSGKFLSAINESIKMVQ